MLRLNTARNATFLRNFVFGVEDSLVSTVGLVSGVAIAGGSQPMIFLTGMVLIFVEAFSMGVGSFLSEESSETFIAQGSVSPRLSLAAALVMFVSYFISGFIPLFPYIVIDKPIQALPLSIGASLLSLLLLGVWGAKLSNLRLWRGGLRMMSIGGLAIVLGVVVAVIMNRFGIAIV